MSHAPAYPEFGRTVAPGHLAADPAAIETALLEHPRIRQVIVTPLEDGRTAVLAAAADGPGHRAREENLAVWRSVFDDQYSAMRPDAAGFFNLTGWNSAYSLEALPDEEMAEWLDRTCERIRRLRPRRVLEVGCGTGLILGRIAPDCVAYTGTDFSPVVTEHLRTAVGAELAGRDVRVITQEANEPPPVSDADTVIVNSVVQYFSSGSYLRDVIDRALEAIPGDGYLFIGDVRSLDLLLDFSLRAELERAGPGDELALVARRARLRADGETELCVSPRFFTALATVLPRIREVRIEPKDGVFENELNDFRYDVTILVGAGAGEATTTATREAGFAQTARGPEWLDWESDVQDQDKLAERLARGDRQSIAILAVRNAATNAIGALWAAEAAGEELAASEARAKLRQQNPRSLRPHEMRALAARSGYTVEFSWSAGHPNGAYDVVMTSIAHPPATLPAWPVAATTRSDADGTQDETNAPPARAGARALLQQELLALLRGLLTEADLQSATVLVVDQLPLGENGEIDREQLSALLRSEQTATEAGPDESGPVRLTPTEQLLHGLWTALLDHPVQPDDDFFWVGGNSLLTFKLVYLLRDHFGPAVQMRAPFQHRTLRALAAHLDELAAAGGGGTA